jgi:hypothetical protein
METSRHPQAGPNLRREKPMSAAEAGTLRPSHAGTHGERNAARMKDVTAHAPWNFRSDETEVDGVDRKPSLVKRKPARVMHPERRQSPGKRIGPHPRQNTEAGKCPGPGKPGCTMKR